MKQKTASASFTHKLLPFLLPLVSHPPKHSRADSLPLLSFQRSLLWTSPVFHPHSSSFRVFYSHPSLLLNKKPGYFPEAAELLLFCFKCYRFLAIKVQPPKKCQFRPELHILNDNIVKQSKTKQKSFLPFDVLYVLMFYIFLALTPSSNKIPFLPCKA